MVKSALAWESPDGDALVVAHGEMSPEVQALLNGEEPCYTLAHQD